MDRAHEPLGPVLSRLPKPPRADLELEAGARAHFEDPAYYSETYGWRDEDVLYYCEVAKSAGRVLEHGIGNGRVALPMARAGVEVTGLDHTRQMLEHLRELLRAEKPSVRRRVSLHEGDIRTARLSKRFPLVICPFNAALHLYTRQDVEQWLARVREHLEPGGELVFDISTPVPEDLARDPNVPYPIPPFEHPTAGRVRYREYFDYDRVRQILFVSMFFDPAPRKRSATSEPSANGKPAKGASKRGSASKTPQAPRTERQSFMTPLAQRQFYPQEMEALLHYNGYEVTALYGDFARGPLVQRSDIMVWHARPRAAVRSRARRASK
ncbi:MAG TPA: class I SAM-dependent methyltransferase [Labilithrix sp.]|nr:class I SAM-dependent methyltransferase [Labilithrix sp.]